MYNVTIHISRYTRNLISTENTHLITCGKDGAKYELALQCPNIHIVTPEWLDACYKTQAYVKEAKYLLVVRSESEEVDATKAEPPSADTTDTMEESVDELLSNYNNESVAQNENIDNNNDNSNTKNWKKCDSSTAPCSLFASCHFLLVGFDEEDQDCEIGNEKRVEQEGTAGTCKKRTIKSFKMKLCKLIRRAKGTIYWDMHPKITHIIVHNDTKHRLHDSLR